MIVVMRPDATKQEVEHVVKLIREMGLKDHPIVGSDLTVVAVAEGRDAAESIHRTLAA